MNLLHELLRSPWFIEKEYAENYLPMALKAIKGEAIVVENSVNTPDKSDEVSSFANIIIENQKKPFVADAVDIFYHSNDITEPSIFMLNLVGPITKYDQFCGPAGMKRKANWLKLADKHPNIFAHVLNIDSGGGSGYACRHMSQVMSELQKPIFAFIDDFGASAAYWIAASSAHIAIGSKMAQAGSIGTYLTVVDYSEYLKMEGIREIEVYAEKSKNKNIDYRKAISGDLSMVQKLANEYNEYFLAHVAQARVGKLKSDDWQTGELYFAEDAVRMGLIDEILSLDEYLIEIFNEYKPKSK